MRIWRDRHPLSHSRERCLMLILLPIPKKCKKKRTKKLWKLLLNGYVVRKNTYLILSVKNNPPGRGI